MKQFWLGVLEVMLAILLAQIVGEAFIFVKGLL